MLLILGLGLLSGSALLAFSWAARDGQLDDLESGARVIFEEDELNHGGHGEVLRKAEPERSGDRRSQRQEGDAGLSQGNNHHALHDLHGRSSDAGEEGRA